MLSVSRFFIALILSAATLAAPAALAASKPLVLEEYFRGRTVGNGVFESGIAGVRRDFRVVTHGTWNPRTFTLRLREDFRYDDGERDTKVWFFQKVAENRYIGTRSDVLNPVTITTGGSQISFDYAANVETGDGPVAVRFFDTLTLVDRRTLRNTADVMKYGLVIGTVDLTFKK
ncbi:DUF3833 family protein [Stappia sp. ES.058]|uniref:DUF3833 family protein n=1 Tax=Stappia sp. ES.058 TaxID=1881061 RepID=UPI00087A4791|nr:DUF3833 family protein [Stappia sp. ES.058]SDT98226.1 Protein of unknown function [Stappia sp. ES.058]